ncbi:hypothetical protein F5J12DRAFT_712728 [Pisolithus orientalis]|uniref:uncharacterized protein n=1 Tax=Pisolithus orientalis TaxID=936130 RepID=UPI00222559C5|nr:uncharacterized protein F5J12DRAFT_712728 [Pisolithus orientalis]KAI6033195.1 hypothetical protein F5J12DRAFT_712728 [Pisolithus orientalis]
MDSPFLDLLLDFLSDKLPPPLYTFLLSFLSHTITLLTALISLVQSLIAAKPWEWDPQTIIPPLISILVAYLALHSLYRTTGWIFRTVFWFVKWGTILAAVSAGMGWYMANQNPSGTVISNLGKALVSVSNSHRRGSVGIGPSHPQTGTAPQTNERVQPKPWDSFHKHRTWQYQEQGGRGTGAPDAQKIMADIAAAAGRTLMEGNWWDAAKTAFTSSTTNRDQPGKTTNDKRQGRAR